MTCTIKIQNVLGLKSVSGLTRMIITGTADACDRVTVTVTCKGSAASGGAEVMGGGWSISLPPHGANDAFCTCDDFITVTAECVGGGCDDTWSGNLVCLDDVPPGCPFPILDVNPIDANSECDGAGRRAVSGKLFVTPDPANPVGVSLSMDGTTIPMATHAPSPSPYHVDFAVPLIPGMHILEWTFLPAFCVGGGQVIHVPNCPADGGCPTVGNLDVEEGDCDKSGRRKVTLKVEITPQGLPTDAQLVRGGVTLDSKTGQTAPFTLTAIDFFPGGINSVVVHVSPSTCAATSHAFHVHACPTDGSSKPPPGNGNGGGGESSGCIFGRIMVVILLGTAQLFALIALCVPGAGFVFVIAAGGAAVVGAIAFALWAAFCGSKCGSVLISWQIALTGAMMCAYMVGCCGPIAAGLGAAFGAAGAVAYAYWIAHCKPTQCKIYSETLWVFAVPLGTAFTILKYTLPCGIPTGVPATAAAIVAALTVAAAAACSSN